MPRYNVSIDRELRCRLYFDMEVEADSKDEAWDTVDYGDLDVRDCEYSDDCITLFEDDNRNSWT